MPLLRRIVRALEQLLQVIALGLVAPIRHPIGLAVSSLPWLALTIFINTRIASHRSWVPFLGFGGQGWHYEPYDYSFLLGVLQIFALILFAALWMRWTARVRLFDGGPKGFGLRLLRIGFAALKLSLVFVVMALADRMAEDLAYHLSSNWYGRDVQIFLAARLVIGAWLATRFAPALASSAIDDVPIGLRRSWQSSRGPAGMILLSMLAPLLLVAWLKTELLSGMGETVRTTFRDLIFDATQLWMFAWQANKVPMDMIVTSALVTWLQLAWLFATLAIAYRSLPGARLSPAPFPSPPVPAARPASS